MKWAYKILRALLVTAIALAVGIPALVYIALCIPAVQEKVKTIAETELTKLFDADVKIGRLGISPFDNVDLHDVSIADKDKRPAINADEISAGIDLSSLIFDKQIVIDHAEIIGMDARISKATPDAPLNIQNIIDALSKKEPEKEPTKFDLQIRDIILRKCAVSYDVLSEPKSAKFNAIHVSLADINADIDIPRLSNDQYVIDLTRFEAKEQSGLTIKSLTASAEITPDKITVKKPVVEMPQSHIALNDITLTKPFIEKGISVATVAKASLALNDVKPLIPESVNTSALPEHITADFDIYADKKNAEIRQLNVAATDNSVNLDLVGNVNGYNDTNSLTANVDRLKAEVSSPLLLSFLSSKMSDKARQTIANAQRITVDGTGTYSRKASSFDGNVTTAAGELVADVEYDGKRIVGKMSTPSFNVGQLVPSAKIGNLSADIDVDVTTDFKRPQGNVSAKIASLQTPKYTYHDITLDATSNGEVVELAADVNDPNLLATLNGTLNIAQQKPHIVAQLDLKRANPERLGIADKFPDYLASATLNIDAEANDIDNLLGTATIAEATFGNGDKNYTLHNVTLVSDNTSGSKHTSLHSDFVDAQIEGDFSYKAIVPYVRGLLATSFPSLVKDKSSGDLSPIDADFSLTVKDSEQLSEWLKMPVRIIYPISLNGRISSADGGATMKIEAPYLQQKDKLIENTSLGVTLSDSAPCELYATTTFPTKKGPAIVTIDSHGTGDRLDTDIAWQIQRQRTFKGNVDFSAAFSRNDESKLVAHVDINPSELIFNDTVWTVNPSTIDVNGKRIEVKDFDVRRADQFITIDGVASDDSSDLLTLELLNIDLDYIFETLEIETAMFGGTASGKFYGTNLLTKEPRLATPSLKVKGLKYNFATLGDADIRSEWNNETRAIDIKAQIDQPNQRKSFIDGAIFPLNDSLDIRFKTDRVNVGFMRPFMAAFTKEVSGEASGDAHLWGTFKDIDLSGDIYAENFKIKIDYTNTYYHTTDSVHIRPGRIEFNNLTLYDDYGNKGRFDGWLTHHYFHEPKFNFSISDTQGMLVYDITPELSPNWYGRIFGNGVAHVIGEPGRIDIDVNMSTARNSIFTFVLSDMEDATEYDFISFRDLTPRPDTVATPDPTPLLVRQLKERIAKQQQQASRPTVYDINLQIEATQEAQMVIVMDPVGGDKIKGYGNGNLRINYDSADDEFEMFGTYSLQRGSYNFTLQDIIIKDFTIRDGSSITFQGDPLAAILDIQAVYTVNANLSDLDESFLQDKELNRTNIPVNAILKVTGDMRQPDVAFDLDFPSLSNSQDVYRKVMSIISTEDMMSRQIVYLLALNRFYTPDYVASATKGNELMSVASSTITSQIRSILGQLSENWVIAPQFRSEKGDFSDVEVDVALSSHLLNNRLLFNGNLGYRDKSLNNNQFVGDFDIEYLLTKSGTYRLKAYNRYNDQNYYARAALTTQGVGIAFKKDFNSFLSFLKKFQKKGPNSSEGVETPKTSADSIVTDSSMVVINPTPVIIQQTNIDNQQ